MIGWAKSELIKNTMKSLRRNIKLERVIPFCSKLGMLCTVCTNTRQDYLLNEIFYNENIETFIAVICPCRKSIFCIKQLLCRCIHNRRRAPISHVPENSDEIARTLNY